MSVSIFVPHAVLYIYDVAGGDFDIPIIQPNDLIAFNEMAVGVGTQAEVDGEVQIDLRKGGADLLPSDHELVFSGGILTPSKKLSVVTTILDIVDSMDVNGSSCVLNIGVDDNVWPSSVIILVENPN